MVSNRPAVGLCDLLGLGFVHQTSIGELEARVCLFIGIDLGGLEAGVACPLQKSMCLLLKQPFSDELNQFLVKSAM